MQLENKIALVTGAVSGIGAAIARRLAGEGARVMLHDQDARRDELAAIANDIPGARCATAQLESAAACAALIEETASQLGGINILVNNAAYIPRANIESTTAELFDKTMAINVRAPLLLFQAALPYFRKAGGARILNIGSINAYTGEPNLLPYSISKGALMTLSRNLADAHCYEGILVNHFNLGWVLTPTEYQTQLNAGLPADWPQQIPKVFAPSGRILSPEEIAHFALAFITSPGPVSGAVVELEQFPVIGRNPAKSE